MYECILQVAVLRNRKRALIFFESPLDTFGPACNGIGLHTPAYVSNVSTRQHTSAYVSMRQHTSAYVSIRQHTSAYVSRRQQTYAATA